uniref:Mating type A-1-3 HMG1/2 n=2 Tax=Epichloe TaxID=5112 RepID=A0A513WX55_EPICN|nr:mating type A-1-3 HMG1/2 [Epichloe sp.]QDH06189.1 mating type A-1-3 HMG1/2 [Epichloe sp.]QDH06203.1 mating type A-1-3 HMG1/2 [Epichloe coenophiala]QDH06209.1 mating type A-1-3 HMG1/2 [Epichloe coenophiala]QDH83280.1 mating type A-1-3 HMG1/2 [Epichloe sp.]
MRPRTQIYDGSSMDAPVTFVTSEVQGNVHVFVPETFHGNLVEVLAKNFSRLVQQPVSVFHDTYRQKFRICPLPFGAMVDTTKYGTPFFSCDLSDPKDVPADTSVVESEDTSSHIPRPRNSWILYRQFKSRELRKDHSGITASELSTMISSLWKNETDEEKAFWQKMAQEEDRLHKEKYPGYKYTTKKNAEKTK